MTTLVDARNTPAPPIFALRAPVNTSATRTDMKVDLEYALILKGRFLWQLMEELLQ